MALIGAWNHRGAGPDSGLVAWALVFIFWFIFGASGGHRPRAALAAGRPDGQGGARGQLAQGHAGQEDQEGRVGPPGDLQDVGSRPHGS